jgi:hypothetical protein
MNVKPNNPIRIGFNQHVSTDSADKDVSVLNEYDATDCTNIAGTIRVDDFDNHSNIKHFHCADTIKKKGALVKPPVGLPITLQPTFRTDSKFNRSGIGQSPTTPATTSFMFDGIPLGEFFAFGNLLQSPPNNLNGLSVVSIL